jgi:hypothetical protein
MRYLRIASRLNCSELPPVNQRGVAESRGSRSLSRAAGEKRRIVGGVLPRRRVYNRGEQTALPLDYENPQFLPNTDIASISNWHQSWNQSLRQIHDFEPHSWALVNPLDVSSSLENKAILYIRICLPNRENWQYIHWAASGLRWLPEAGLTSGCTTANTVCFRPHTARQFTP